MLVIKVVKLLNVVLICAVRFVVLGQKVLNALVVAPLNKLRNFVTHKVELTARVRHLVERKRAHARKLTPVIARLPADKRTFTVHNLIVRKRQNKVFVKLIHRSKRKQVMRTTTERKVALNVMQCVVHPAHIPLKVEAQTANLRRITHEWPRR